MATDALRVFAASDVGWDRLLDGVEHDFYHRRGYHGLAEWNGEGQARMAVVERDGAMLAWPYLRRPIPGTPWSDAGCVYGYPGPLLAGLAGRPAAEADGLRRHLWQRTLDHWKDEDVVSVFTTFDPLIGNASAMRGLQADAGPAPIVTLGRTVSIDLGPTSAERRAGYEKETRYEIGRAHRAGLRTTVDRSGAHLADLARLYDQTMRRNSASDRYLFSPDYLERLLAVLDERGRLLVATMAGGTDVVGVLLFVIDGRHAHAHLTGVAQEHLRLAPLNAMLDAAADAARDEGAEIFHLGAGRGGVEDSLFRFKRRIGSLERSFDVGRWVVDAERYRLLTGAEGDGGRRDDVDSSSFFPAYRRIEQR